MIDKDTALALLTLLRLATAGENVPYETRELKESALSAIDDVLRHAESEVESHYDPEYRHDWYDNCDYCSAGILPDKRQTKTEQEAHADERAARVYAEQQLRRKERLAAVYDPESPFNGA